MNDYPFGHYANEDDRPAPLCPWCGGYHFLSGHCPEDGPPPVEGPEEWPLPEEPDWVKDPGASGYPSWVYEQIIDRPSEN